MIENKIELFPNLRVVVKRINDYRVVFIQGKWPWWDHILAWILWSIGLKEVMCDAGADWIAQKLLFQLPTEREVVFIGKGVLNGSIALGLSKMVDRSMGILVSGREWKKIQNEIAESGNICS